MSTFSSRRVGALLFYLFFHIAGVLGRGGGKGEGGGEGGGEGEGGTIADGADTGSDIGDAASSGLGLSPELNAVFAIAIVIAVITLLQLIRCLVRFKHLISRDSELALSHTVGALFPVLLVFYTATYIANNVLRALYVVDFGDSFFWVSTLGVGMQFTSQFSTILLYSTFLAIIAYRQKNQLNRQESVFNLKTVFDGLLLTTMLVLGVAEAIIAGPGRPFEDFITLMNMSLAFEVLGLLASLNVAISAYKARDRLSNAGIYDKVCPLENHNFLVLTSFLT
jgi:hypothetical protein